MTATAAFAAVNYECADPAALAAFYQVLGGGEITYSDENYGAVTMEGGVTLYFARTEDYQRPTWPEPGVPQQAHLDFYVEDLDKAEAHLLEHGAGKPAHQPGGERWRVLTDPSGHPFCICIRSE